MNLLRMATAAILCAGLTLGVTTAIAQEYPTRSIRIVLPFAAGGGTDLVARILSERMRADFGQSVVVDNRPSAGGNIGSEIVVNSLQHPDMQAFMRREGAEAVGSSPTEAAAFFRREVEKFAKIIKASGAKPES